MGYERPPLVMAIGSRGGYKAFIEVMSHVEPEISGRGSIYLAEHCTPNIPEMDKLETFGIHLKRVRNDMKLETGKLYLQSGVYETGKGRILIIGRRGNDDELRFLETERHERLGGLSWSIKSAIEAGYGGEDMLIACLNGCGRDGSSALFEIRGKTPHILIQDPATADFDSMPREMEETAEAFGLPHMVLPPAEIGLEISRFFGSF